MMARVKAVKAKNNTIIVYARTRTRARKKGRKEERKRGGKEGGPHLILVPSPSTGSRSTTKEAHSTISHCISSTSEVVFSSSEVNQIISEVNQTTSEIGCSSRAEFSFCRDAAHAERQSPPESLLRNYCKYLT